MAKIDENAIAKLKALFQDNEKALGSNFSQLIDFFNDNKVTDNGDGTFSVGGINLDASKLYNLIISGVTQQQLATKADDSKVVHTTDMRKPAGDVAGIEEVNVKADDNKVVHDNHDGTEQLNGIQVQPFNKLSDVMNLRNIVLQTDNVIPYTAKGGAGEVMKAFPLYSGFSSLPSGTQIYYSYDLVVTNADGGTQWLSWTSPWSTFAESKSITTDGIHHFQGTAIIPDKDIVSGQTISSTVDNSHATYQITNLMIVVGSVPVTHLPAPEDKVNVADMRKPAGDVVGLEDVPTAINQGHIANGTDMDTITQEGTYILGGHSFVNFIDTGVHWGILQVTNQDAMVIQTAKCTTNHGDVVMIRSQSGTPATWSIWTLFLRIGLDGKMIMPDGRIITPADDSKVAHLSGANNFDITPTVNNNPLLLASSLPSDLARTGQSNTFSKQQIFSANPTNGTQVYPIYATVGTDADATTLIASLQSSGFSGIIGVPES